MKQKIYYDSNDYSGAVWFWVIIIILCCCCFWWPSGNYTYTDASYNAGWGWWWWLILGIFFFWWIIALCFAPLDVTADDDEVRIRRPFKTRRIRMDEIDSVQPYQVSAKPGKKTFGSLPIRTLGKWGKYHDDKIGDYFAYYGNPNNTVLIKLKDGRQYVVGGTDAKALSDYINDRKK